MQVLKSENTEWGFYGTIRGGNRGDKDFEWERAFNYIKAETVDGIPLSPEETRGFLDSKAGRHLADSINELGSIEAVIARWPLKGFWFAETIRAFRSSPW